MTNSKKFLIAGWVSFILGYFFLVGLLPGLPDAGPGFPILLIGLFPLGLILLFVGFKKILNKVIIVCVFVLLVIVFFQATPKGRAHDASIQASLNAMRAEAELSVVGNDYPANICDQNDGPLSNLFKAIILQKASDIRCFIGSDLKSWAVSTKLRDTKKFFCSDSTGFSGNVTGNITSPSCVSVKAETKR